MPAPPAVLAFALLFAVAACAPSRDGAGPAPPPSDLVVLVGRADGAGGRVSGHSIRADGAVLRWTGRAPEETVSGRGALSASRVEALWQRIAEVGVMEMQRQDLGSPAYFVSVRADGETRRVQWHVPLGQAPEETPLQALYAELTAAAEAAVGAR